ncbi:MAG: Uma2 family endonuclease [Deltaproteobacteria bacterium]|nr:Uma2 family endonuclease [Deltaproteobacteria bacterium]
MPKGRATYADIESLAEGLVGEIIDGELVVQPRPRPAHAVLSAQLSGQLTLPFGAGRGGPGGWIFMIEPELRFGPPGALDVLVPDLAAWRRDRMPILPEESAIRIVPDWVGEIISPSTSRYDRGPKREIYRREGVGHLWLIDLDAQSIEVFRRAAEHWLLVETFLAPGVVRVEPFAAVELDLGLLFAR